MGNNNAAPKEVTIQYQNKYILIEIESGDGSAQVKNKILEEFNIASTDITELGFKLTNNEIIYHIPIDNDLKFNQALKRPNLEKFVLNLFK